MHLFDFIKETKHFYSNMMISDTSNMKECSSKCGFYMKKNVAFTPIPFTVLKWDDCLSVQLPFKLPVQIPVQLLLELEPNWLVQNVIGLEFELSKM